MDYIMQIVPQPGNAKQVSVADQKLNDCEPNAPDCPKLYETKK